MKTPHLSRRAFTLGAATLLAGSRISGATAQSREPGDPMLAAEQISRLEVMEHIPALYTFYERMHPDAQEIVPRHVVIRYFREVFQQRDPQPAVATSVIYRDWTWGINGVTYPHTAEVSFTQEFANETITDVVRLVAHEGEWRWFFGRDRAWVDEQVLRFSQTMQVPEEGQVPFGLERVQITADILNRLPERLDAGQFTSLLESVQPPEETLPAWADSEVSLRYVTEGDIYPTGYAQVLTLKPQITTAQAIREQVESQQQHPPFTLHAWNLTPENDTPFAVIEHLASEAVGNARTIYWGAADGTRIAIISHVDEAALEQMATALR